MPTKMCPDKKSWSKKSLKLQASSSSKGQEPDTRVDDLVLKNTELSHKNAQLAQEVQKLKLNNGQLLKTVMELKKKNVEASLEILRVKEVCRRINQGVNQFVPVMIRGSEFLEYILKESENANFTQAETSNTSASNHDGSVEDAVSSSSTPASPSRTGIARPIIQGHTIISKPSISLERVGLVPRGSANPYVPVPVSALNLVGLVRGDEERGDEERGDDERPSLSDVSEEGDGDGSGRNEPVEAAEEELEDEEEEQSSRRDSGTNIAPSEASESSAADETLPVATRLSVITERSAMTSPVEEERSSTPRASPSTSRASPYNSKASPSTSRASPSMARASPSSSTKKKSEESVNQAAKRSRPEEEPVESSDDEAVELSLIASRCKLMNGDRRAELKEGTSKDYDARGNFSPHSRRKKKRKKEESRSPAREENETSAIRKSVSGLLNSLKKGRVSKSRVSEGESPSGRVSVNGVEESSPSVPRVSLMRLGSWRKSGGPSAFCANDPVPASPAMPMVSKRRRRSYVTTRNKRSRPLPAEEVLEEPPPPPRRSVKATMSWTELMRRRSQSQEKEDDDDDMEVEELVEVPATTPAASTPGPAIPDLTGRTVEELTIILSRCSDSFIARNTSQRSTRESINDSTAHLSVRDASDNSMSRKSPNESVSKRTKSKARSKPRLLPKAPKTNGQPSEESRNPKRSANSSGVDNDLSMNSLNPSTINSSATSSVGERDSTAPSPRLSSATGRPRRAKAPTSLKEMSLNSKLRRT